jgi:intracellular sulfur oxidation DsrE/DsrF family protein
MKKLLQRLTIIIILITVQFVSKAQNANVIHKVVIQLNTADTAAWSGTIGNIKNLQKIWPGAILVEVVAHGKGLDLLVKAKTHLASEVEALVKEGVVFSACENSMKKHNVTKADLLMVAGTVPSGVAELVLKQEQGWSYLKASVN